MSSRAPAAADDEARPGRPGGRPPGPAPPASGPSGREPFPGGDAPELWSAPEAALLAALGTTPGGLSGREAARRLARYGPNRLAPPGRRSTLRLLTGQFASPIALLLVVAAALSLVVGETADGLIILGIILCSGALGFWQERRAAGAVSALLAMVQTRALVLRDGARREVPLESVVPGDVVLLGAGDMVPGDARVLESKDLHVDEAALTGESYPAEKRPGVAAPEAEISARANALFFGTHVVSGTAAAVVAETGARTVFGRLSAELGGRPPTTEFEHGVRRFGYLLLEAAVAMALAIFAVNVALERPVLDSLLFTLALAVGLTPQLLPAIVSVTLSEGARRMAAAKVIVRRLTAIEDVGGITVLCTDKTGTLTRGVVAVGGALDVDGGPSEKLRLYVYLNAAFETGYANPIDDALRREPAPGAAAYRKLDEVPYDFVRRRQSVLAGGHGGAVLITKGALASVLEICAEAELPSGRRVPVGDVRGRVLGEYERLSGLGYRCLGVAFREVGAAARVTTSDERDMVLLGLLSLEDPPKPGALESMRRLEELGISLKLVTGDNARVARKVGLDVGLDAASVLTGAQLRAMSDAALVRLAPRVSVFAEMEPNQKERVIVALKRAGLAVGYLGDGINDAAALHAADVGISVESATDVTKEAADIVLLDKDLAVLVEGVREGRRAFANTLKYVFITTSANFGNMVSMAGASLVTAFLPLLPKQILLLNVLSDLPAMAVASDRLDPELVATPRRWDVRSIGRFMACFGLVSSAFDFLTFGTLLALGVPAALFRAGWFEESLLSEILILLVIRTRRRFYRSLPGRALVAASAGVAAAAVALPYTPLAGPLGLAPIPARLWAVIAGILTTYVLASELAKRAFRGGP